MPKDQKCKVLGEAVHLFLEKPHGEDFAEMNPEMDHFHPHCAQQSSTIIYDLEKTYLKMCLLLNF